MEVPNKVSFETLLTEVSKRDTIRYNEDDLNYHFQLLIELEADISYESYRSYLNGP